MAVQDLGGCYARVVSHVSGTPVFVLSMHADYACRRSGACCVAGWDVPVEPGIATGLEKALNHGRLRPADSRSGPGAALIRMPPPPAGTAAILGQDASGTCMFLERGADAWCLVHRSLGHDALPAACRQFPRIALFDARGVHVTLSHFCPTAASLLFYPDVGPTRIVPAPSSFRPRLRYEGFDASSTIPPLVRPGLVFDLESYTEWEAWQIRTLDRDDLGAEEALGVIARAAESLRSWTPAEGRMIEAVERCVTMASSSRPGPSLGASTAGSPFLLNLPAAVRTFTQVVRLVRCGLPVPSVPAPFDRAFEALVESAWASLARPTRRYLAAKAFAAWSAYQGEGIRTNVAVLGVALDVVKVECARQMALAARPLDALLLMEAVRQTDLLIEHLIDRSHLARLVAPVESLDRDSFLSRFPL